MGDQVRQWLPAVGAFVLGVLVLKLKDWFKRLVDKAGAALYRRLAGSALLRRTALRRYTIKTHERHRSFSVSFQPARNRAMDMASVYVPLRTATGFGAEQREATASLHESRQAVVLGVPGAGKTMLLRHTVLAWARERYRPDLPARRTWYDPRRRHRVDLGTPTDIPVLLSLHSVDLDAGDITAHIVNHFADHDFPNAGTWVERALDEGRLAVYFDGLDEVPTTQRPRVAAAIRRFMKVYDRCRAVVTCRVAVYRGEFAQEAVPVLLVEEFDDRLIQRFLHGWPWPPNLAPDTVEQLLGALRDTPQLKPLARNPLLLTMIAHLYSYEYAGTDQVLPHNRADFYNEVTVSLLRDRDLERVRRFPATLKRAVLQQLALAAQSVPSDAYDRLAMPYEKVRREVGAVLERLGRPVEETDDILSEIVDRSGLLLAIDNGERYQFAHLTLQEYLAAKAVQADVLLDRYRGDPHVWREVVRLWCGAEPRDCTPLVREVLAVDPLLAFQCLADAQLIDDGLADEIIAHFGALLGDDSASLEQEAVVAAFGVVAAQRRARGVAVFELLCAAALDTTNPARASMAVRALAATNVLKAARFLAEGIVVLPGAEEALVAMGDLAVPALMEKWPSAPSPVAWVLWRVRTEKATLALWNALSTRDPENPGAAYLADLLRDRALEEVLRDVRGPTTGRARFFEWVWKPFSRRGDEQMATVASTLAYALSISAFSDAPLPDEVRPDPRLLVPLVLVEPEADSPVRIEGPVNRWLGLLSDPVETVRSGQRAERVVVREMMSADALPNWRGWLIDRLPPQEARRTLDVLLTSGYLTKAMWERSTVELADRKKPEWTDLAWWGLALYAVTGLGAIARSVAALLGWHPWNVSPHWIAPTVGLAVLLGGLAVCAPLLATVEDPQKHVKYGVLTWVTLSVPLSTAFALSTLLNNWTVAAVAVLLLLVTVLCMRPAYRRVTVKFSHELLRLIESLATPYAPGQGPGVSTSASNSTFVSNSLNPRR
ncbi:NACHT domain-containing protein [Streptomyces diastatochromogenes]|uniref:NACHT domain-containing protein n=1 Tax=Streptomyces diastatochromogenes TaxID=42236 RepID=UPI0036BD5833